MRPTPPLPDQREFLAGRLLGSQIHRKMSKGKLMPRRTARANTHESGSGSLRCQARLCPAEGGQWPVHSYNLSYSKDEVFCRVSGDTARTLSTARSTTGRSRSPSWMTSSAPAQICLVGSSPSGIKRTTVILRRPVGLPPHTGSTRSARPVRPFNKSRSDVRSAKLRKTRTGARYALLAEHHPSQLRTETMLWSGERVRGSACRLPCRSSRDAGRRDCSRPRAACDLRPANAASGAGGLARP